ncbi:WG repeat-containing protein [Chitinophaga sp. HK235]|uniref:WG repeat-containing protein n=1 Tax=Chitinophaga sp. HK235 TaxID=2952571 RepID=UPI001BAC8D43|nr:WG repeat-containing protein [Chitinophaga sp. HK235]
MKPAISILCGLLLTGNTLLAQQGSVFVNGFARIANKGKNWYIDTTGARAFDKIIETFHPVDSITDQRNGFQSVHENENRQMAIVSSNHKVGVVDDQGKWVLKPLYDKIEVKWKTYLALYQQGKMTYADTWGKLLLPMMFEDAGILDDDRFDVKQQGKWGVYSVSQKKLVIPAIYDAIDFCGGCGSKSDYVYAQKNGKWGIVSSRHEILVPFEFQHSHSMMRSDEWVCSFQQKGKAVIVNIPLKKVYASPEYSDMEIVGNGLLRLKKNGYFGLINKQGKVVLDFLYEDISDPYGTFTSGPFLTFTKDRKTGVVTESGRVVAPPVFEDGVTCAGDYFIAAQDGLYNVYDSTGKPLLKQGYNDISGMAVNTATGDKEQLFSLKRKALYGFYNPANGKLVEPAFHEVRALETRGLLEVTYQQKTGLYKPDATLFLPVRYDSYSFISDKLLSVKTQEGTGVYDVAAQQEIVPARYYDVDVFGPDSNLFKVTLHKNDQYIYGLYDLQGKELLPATYADITTLNKDQCLLTSEVDSIQHFELFALSNAKITTWPYTEVSPSGAPGLLIVSDGKNSFLWNITSAKVISAPFPMHKKYDWDTSQTVSIQPFINGIAPVVKNGKVGLINVSGQEVVPFIYDGAAGVKTGQILLLKKYITVNGLEQLKYGYVDTTGKLITPVEYDYDENSYLSDIEDSTYLKLFKAAPDSRYGYIQGLADRQGKILLPVIYDKIFIGEKGTGFLAETQRQFVVLDATGKPVSQDKFTSIMLDLSANPYATSAVIPYPLLCRKGNRYVYLLSNGKQLPVQLDGTVPFLEGMDTVTGQSF